jgi:uncharacterized delta-60 repeat protein
MFRPFPASPIRFLSTALTLGVSLTQTAQSAPGDPDISFTGSAAGNVYGVSLQSDNKLIIASDTAGTSGRRFIGRLNTNGSLDTAFLGDTNNWVVCSATQADGKILIGGTFTTAGGSTRRGLARLNADGSLDSTFNANLAGFFSNVFCIAIQADGKILVGGNFSSVGSTPRARIARLNANGSIDTTFIANTNDDVYSIAVQADGKILIAGNFTSVFDDNNLTDTRNFIARLNSNGSIDPLFNPDCDNSIYCMALQADGRIVVGGPLTAISGVSRTNLGRINADGTLDTGFNPTLDGVIYSIALQADGKVIIAGNISTVSGESRQRVARLLADGSVDTDFAPIVDNLVHSATLQGDGKLVIAGYFSSIGENYLERSFIARLENDPVQQSLLVTGTSKVTWMRGGTLPEAQDVVFESSTNGSSWTPRGTATRIAGGWELSGLSLPASGQVRARARIPGGYYNGSSSYLLATASYPASAIDAWRQQYFGSTANSGNGANTNDFDKDGLQNFVEYAFGLDPTKASSNELPQPELSGGNLTLNFTRPVSVSGLTYRAEWSTSLTSGPWTEITNTATPPNYSFSVPTAGKSRLYFRHKLSIP